MALYLFSIKWQWIYFPSTCDFEATASDFEAILDVRFLVLYFCYKMFIKFLTSWHYPGYMSSTWIPVMQDWMLIAMAIESKHFLKTKANIKSYNKVMLKPYNIFRKCI